jgi:hypothetical protein
MPDLLQDKKRSLAGWPMVIGFIAMLIFALHASTHMVGAGDTWVALACGRHFYNHGVDTNEPFSANSHRVGPTEEEIRTWPEWAQTITDKVGLDTVKYWHPTGWVNQNWLTHVIFHWLAFESPFADGPSLSFNTLMYWKFAVYILTVICVYFAGRVMGAHPALSAAAACASMFIGRSFIDIRPAGFSNLMVAVFLLILVLSIYRNYLYIWLLLPATVFWANLHGGYIYTFIMLTPVVGIRVLGLIWRKLAVQLDLAPAKPTVAPLPGTTLPALWHTMAAGTIAFLASIIFNPFHLTNLTHTFQISISANAEGWRNVHEWWPAFRWDNPVGSAFAFMVMMIVGIGLPIIWILSRMLVPKSVKPVRQQPVMNEQGNGNVLAKIIGFIGAALIIWAIMISFSLADVGPTANPQQNAISNTLYSFLLNGLFVGILWASIFISVHFIYVILLFALFALYTGDVSVGYTGRYIFPFVTVPFYCWMFAICSGLSKKPKYSMLNVVYVLAASVAAILISAITINPFKFTQPVWHLEQFLNLRRIWQPLFEANLEITDKYLFQVIFVINVICIVGWILAPYVKEAFDEMFAGRGGTSISEDYEYRKPKVDIALVAIAALTVYMAIRSRRFIPISGYVTCPVIALFVDQIIQMLAVSRYFRKTGRLTLPRMPFGIQSLLTAGAAVLVIGLGTWWGLKFKFVYIDPWPMETKLTSAFIRMTASGAKPFEACRFITENKMRGNMFNYWTEGGFVAWGQIPDADGHTPLQLFMDGRAQAAYNYQAYQMWSEIMAGGPISQKVMARGRSYTPEDYVKIGEWLDQRLKQSKVWVILMPSNQFDTPFVKGIEHNGNWRMVYLDDKQKLYVDISTQRGKELFEGIENGETIYPDQSYRNILIAHNAILFYTTPERTEKGLKCAMSSFDENPSRTAVQLMEIYYKQYPQLQPMIDGYWQNYLADFRANKKKYLNSNGYYFRAMGALMAMGHLQPTLQGNEIEQFEKDRLELQRTIETMQDKRW